MDRAWQQYAVHTHPPKEILRPFSLPEKTLTGPGPSNCSNRVLDVLGRQVLGHLHPEICQVFPGPFEMSRLLRNRRISNTINVMLYTAVLTIRKLSRLND